MANWKHEITLTVWHQSETDDGRAAADVFGQQIIREVVYKLTPRADLLASRCQRCLEDTLPHCLERWASGLPCWDVYSGSGSLTDVQPPHVVACPSE
jgi:hypothetical protein